MATDTTKRIAESVLDDLHDLCERLRRLKPAEERELAKLLRAVYRYTIIDGHEGEPPLGVEWSLRDGDVAKTLYENMTGESVE